MLTLPSFNHGLLSDYYATGGGLPTSLVANRLRQSGFDNADDGVVPPWQLRQPTLDDKATLDSIFSSSKLIDLDDPTVANAGDNDSFKSLFALYRGLSKLQEIAEYAHTGARASSYRTLLESKFKDSLQEIQDYVGGLEFENLDLLYGIEDSEAASSLIAPTPGGDLTPERVGRSVTTVREDAIPGLTGSESFTLSVTEGVTTTDLTINLSAVSGTLNVDNIANHINDELFDQGFSSTFQVERAHEFAYGFRVQSGVGETVTLTAETSSAEAAVYVAGNQGAGSFGTGFVTKITELDEAVPEDSFITAIDSEGADTTNAIARDSQGNTIIVGQVGADLDGFANAEPGDTYVRKLDSSGVEIWTRQLGAGSDSAGFAVTVDADDNVIVTGQTAKHLNETAYGGNFDTFVSKFDADGREVWTKQAAPYANDSGRALAADAAGNIFVAGVTNGNLSGSTSHSGGSDGYIRRLDSNGATVWDVQFGSSADDRVNAIKVDNAGNLFVAAEVNGDAIVRKYSDDGTSASLTWQVNLGSLGAEGGLDDLVLGQGGAVYVAGTSSNTGLAGSITNGHSGGSDGFVTRINDAGSSASADFTRYLGTTGTDTARGLAVDSSGANDEIYVTGRTDGSIGGATQVGDVDGYVVKIDDAGGQVWSHQFGGGLSHTPNAIAIDTEGDNVLTKLGLGQAPNPTAEATALVDLTTIRPGDNFKISVDGRTAQRITIDDDDSYGFLAFKINRVLGAAGTATMERDTDGRRLTITAKEGHRLQLFAGEEGEDALAKLGLQESFLVGKAESSADSDSEDDADSDARGVFALGLFDNLTLTSTVDAGEASVIVDNAIRELKNAYRFLTGADKGGNPLADVTISQADSERIAALQGSLARISELVQVNSAGIQSRNQGGGGLASGSLFSLVT